jgi:hypothetical protein
MPGDPACQQVKLEQLLPCVATVATEAAALAHTATGDASAAAAATAAADAESLRVLVVPLASNHVVRAEALTEALLPATLLRLLAKSAVPFAAINKDKTSYADSILLLKLDGPAPRACCPANIAIGERSETRTYKTIAPEHQNLLAVLVQSKLALQQHCDPNEVFVREYAKCIHTPIPFIFVLISDAPHVAHQQNITWPFNGNGYFVGRDQLRQLYGEFLSRIRAEAWLSL